MDSYGNNGTMYDQKCLSILNHLIMTFIEIIVKCPDLAVNVVRRCENRAVCKREFFSKIIGFEHLLGRKGCQLNGLADAKVFGGIEILDALSIIGGLRLIQSGRHLVGGSDDL